MGAKSNLLYHVVLVTKYRRSCLFGLEETVTRAMRYVESKSRFHIEGVAVEKGNHVHLIIRTSPKYSVDSIVNRLKSMSMVEIWRGNEEHLRKYYWNKRKKLLWNGGYYVSTLGNVSVEQCLDYFRKDSVDC